MEFSNVDMLLDMETNMSAYYSTHIPVMIDLQGTTVDHYKKVLQAEEEVYGVLSGLNVSNVPLNSNVRVLVNSFQWRVLTNYDGSYLDDIGYMFCTFDCTEGDYIKFKRLDQIEQGFTIINTEMIGLTQTPVYRFKISNISE